jgi:hypothetical protein
VKAEIKSHAKMCIKPNHATQIQLAASMKIAHFHPLNLRVERERRKREGRKNRKKIKELSCYWNEQRKIFLVVFFFAVTTSSNSSSSSSFQLAQVLSFNFPAQTSAREFSKESNRHSPQNRARAAQINSKLFASEQHK